MALGLNYTVKENDTLEAIANRMGADPQAFLDFVLQQNNITKPEDFYIGQKLLVGYEVLKPEIRTAFEASGATRSPETPVEPYLPAASAGSGTNWTVIAIALAAIAAIALR